jgi:superfamily II DNA or RNA helicase
MSITLRPRQNKLVNLSLKALEIYGNTLSIAPTGAGKTIMMASILSLSIKNKQRALVLQHRHELLEQNQNKFVLMNPSLTTSLFRSGEKNTEG